MGVSGIHLLPETGSPSPGLAAKLPMPGGGGGLQDRGGLLSLVSVSIQLGWGPRWERPFGGWRTSLVNTQVSEVHRGPIHLQENK